MKRPFIWINIILVFLLLAACGANEASQEPTEFRVACFGCKEKFVSGQLNPDFGLCQDCMLQVGAAYCQECSNPCYTRDMIHGLCKECSNAATETTVPETTAAQENVMCTVGGHSVEAKYIVEDYCIGCYCIRFGKCLRCRQDRENPNSGHCDSCSKLKFFCADCKLLTNGNEMFMDLCEDCYGKANSVLVLCPLCGRNLASKDIRGGYCESCRAQADYHEDERNFAKCDYCGITYGYSDPLVCGICQDCWGEGYGPVGVCRMCGKSYTDNEGFEGLCFSCEDKYGPKCSVCGTDLTYRGGIDGMCDDCYNATHSCKGCGSTDIHKDGYCYYCHPDFTWYCRECGRQQPGYGPTDKICDACRTGLTLKCSICGKRDWVVDNANDICRDCCAVRNLCFVCKSNEIYKDGRCFECHEDSWG